MFDSSALIQKFHDEYVTLTQALRQDMHSRRDANLDRLKSGLKELGKPSIAESFNQGGNAMQTMTQQPEADKDTRNDIDVAGVFESADALSPTTTKAWVRDAIKLKATNLKNPPESKKKCVRVIYSDGYQCDIAVFRRHKNGDTYTYEIAIGDEWIASDPKAVNAWFEQQLKEKSPDEEGGFQLRRIVRFVKYFCKVHAHHKGTAFPAGLVATAAAVEAYRASKGRDDEALYSTLKAISQRSALVPVFANGMQVSGKKDEKRLERLIDAAKEAVTALAGLVDDADNIENKDVLSAWKKVFRHSFFDSDTAEDFLRASATMPTLTTKSAVVSPAIISALTDADRLRRAEAAAAKAAAAGDQTRPWNKRDQ